MSGLDWLTPEASLVALAVTAPLVVLVAAARRGERARVAVGLPARRSLEINRRAATLLVVGGLVGVAAAQPVLRSRDVVSSRTDAAVWVVVDTSRSMLAASGAGETTRIERARRAALRLRAALPEVPVGVASLSDRVLPHLFPSPDRGSFVSTMTRTIRAGAPPPTAAGPVGTNLGAIAALPRSSFFEPSHRRRAAIVLTDGESPAAPAAELAAAFRGTPHTALVLVRIGAAGERVYGENGRPEPGYEPVRGAAAAVASVAEAAGGDAFADGDLGAAERALRSALGTSGPTGTRERDERGRPLAPYVLALTTLPLAWLARRRILG